MSFLSASRFDRLCLLELIMTGARDTVLRITQREVAQKSGIAQSRVSLFENMASEVRFSGLHQRKQRGGTILEDLTSVLQDGLQFTQSEVALGLRLAEEEILPFNKKDESDLLALMRKVSVDRPSTLQMKVGVDPHARERAWLDLESADGNLLVLSALPLEGDEQRMDQIRGNASRFGARFIHCRGCVEGTTTGNRTPSLGNWLTFLGYSGKCQIGLLDSTPSLELEMKLSSGVILSGQKTHFAHNEKESLPFLSHLEWHDRSSVLWAACVFETTWLSVPEKDRSRERVLPWLRKHIDRAP